MKVPRYKTEAALCADFITWVKAESGTQRRFGAGRSPVWTPYAETAGWDILLVAADGTQIGVQAKLRFNLKVIAQSIPDRWSWENFALAWERGNMTALMRSSLLIAAFDAECELRGEPEDIAARWVQKAGSLPKRRGSLTKQKQPRLKVRSVSERLMAALGLSRPIRGYHAVLDRKPWRAAVPKERPTRYVEDEES